MASEPKKSTPPKKPVAPPADAKHGENVTRAVLADKNPRAAYKALSGADRAAFRSTLRNPPTKTKLKVRSVSGPQGDWRRGDKPPGPQGDWRRGDKPPAAPETKPEKPYSGCLEAEAVTDALLVVYRQTTRVCVNAGKITDVTVKNVHAQIQFPGIRPANDPSDTETSIWAIPDRRTLFYLESPLIMRWGR